MPEERAKVESFKLTPEIREWGKQFRQINVVSKMIEQGLRIRYDELEQGRRLFEGLEERRQEMLRMAPTEQTKELPGQEDLR